MEKHNFPEIDTHKKLHQGFSIFFEGFKRKFYTLYSSPGKLTNQNIKELLKEAKDYLGLWWVNHILKIDHEYAEYIKTHEK